MLDSSGIMRDMYHMHHADWHIREACPCSCSSACACPCHRFKLNIPTFCVRWLSLRVVVALHCRWVHKVVPSREQCKHLRWISQVLEEAKAVCTPEIAKSIGLQVTSKPKAELDKEEKKDPVIKIENKLGWAEPHSRYPLSFPLIPPSRTHKSHSTCF